MAFYDFAPGEDLVGQDGVHPSALGWIAFSRCFRTNADSLANVCSSGVTTAPPPGVLVPCWPIHLDAYSVSVCVFFFMWDGVIPKPAAKARGPAVPTKGGPAASPACGNHLCPGDSLTHYSRRGPGGAAGDGRRRCPGRYSSGDRPSRPISCCSVRTSGGDTGASAWPAGAASGSDDQYQRYVSSSRRGASRSVSCGLTNSPSRTGG